MRHIWQKTAAALLSAGMLMGLAACGSAAAADARLDEISASLEQVRSGVERYAAARDARLSEEARAAAAAAAAEAAEEAARLAEEERLAAEEAAVKLIGERDESLPKITLYNDTGYDLDSVCIKVPEEGWTDNLLPGDVYADGEKRYLFYEAARAGGDDGYSFWVNMVGDWAYTLHDFPFGDIAEGRILYDHDGDVCYLSYTSLATGRTEDTFAAEYAIAEAEREARRQAEAAAAAAAAAAAQAQADSCLTDGLFW